MVYCVELHPGHELDQVRKFHGGDSAGFQENFNYGHEIIQVYDGRLVNSGLYAQAEMSGHEAGAGEFKVLWKHLDEFNPQTPLYPDGLLELLK